MNNKPIISVLEPRLLFDGAAVTTAVDVLDNNSFDNESIDFSVTVDNSTNTRKEIAFIDTGVNNYEKLLDEFDENVEIFLLNKDSNGLNQISEILKNKEEIDSIHIISHGDIGKISIGNSSISLDNISLFTDQLKNISNSLTQNADILLYGCSVGETKEGKEFVDRFSLLTKADVAASDDITGSASLKGDWELEYKTGNIETFSISSNDFDEVLNTAPELTTRPVIDNVTNNGSSSFTLVTDSILSSDISLAFDNDSNTNFENDLSGYPSISSIIDIDLGENYVITALELVAANDDVLNSPDNFKLYGTNNINDGYTQLSGGGGFLTTPSNPGDSTLKEFSLNSTSYRYYRLELNILLSSPSEAKIKLSDIKLDGYKEPVASYTENSSPVQAIENLGLNDDSSTLYSATVSISNYESSDILSFTKNMTDDYGDITASYSNGDLILTSISGSTHTQFKNALLAVYYSSSSDDPTENGSTKTINWSVNDGVSNSNTDTSTVVITAQNDAPEITIGIGDSVIGTIAEEGILTQSGTLTFSDIDSSDTSFTITSAATISATSQGGGSLTLTSGQISTIESGFSPTFLQNVSEGTINWSYTVNESDIDFIGEGEIVTATFTITVSDGNGGTDTENVIITINGKNDGPEIQVVDVSGNILEGSILTDSGSVTFSDVDYTDSITINSNFSSSTGLTTAQEDILKLGFSITSSGVNTSNGTVNWTYTINDADLDFLAAGETVTLSYLITATDDETVSTSKTVVVSITGTNDNPTVVGIDLSGSISEEGNLSESGSISFSDIDLLDTPTASFANGTISATAQGGGSLTLTSGQIAIIQSGFSLNAEVGNTNVGTINWDYTVSEDDIGFLGEGEVVTAEFLVTVNDGNGGTNTQTVTITISGKNDIPTITSVENGSITENAGILSSNGSVYFTDIDYTDRPSSSLISNSISALQSDGLTSLLLTTQQKTDITDAFSISSNIGNTNIGTVDWTYSIDGSKLDFLAENEVVTALFTIKVLDDELKSDTQDVQIKITGTNDTPLIEIVYINGNIIEGSSNLSDTGSIKFTDVDVTDSFTVTENTKTISAVQSDEVTQLVLSSQQESDIENGFSIFTSNGVVQWDYSISEDKIDFLSKDEVLTAVFTITVDDNEGGIANQDVTVKITGTNDSPVIEVSTQTGEITENDGTLSTNGEITFSDVDTTNRPESSFTIKDISAVEEDGNTSLILTSQQIADIQDAFSITDDISNTNSGTINWIYSIDGSKLDFLSKDEVVTAIFTVTITDEESVEDTRDITITITGTNDIPEIQIIDISASLTENSILSDNGSITFSDIDTTNRPLSSESTKSITAVLKDNVTPLSLSAQQILDIENAFSISNDISNTNNGTVNWNFSISEDKIDYLAQDEVLTAVFTISVSDGKGGISTQDVTITITGTNDTPTVSLIDIDDETVYSQEYTKDISSLFNDIDSTDIFTYEITGLPSGLTYDSATGVISGRVLEIGYFDIEIKAYDSGNPALMVSRTYELLVLSSPDAEPPQREADKETVTPIELDKIDLIQFDEDDIQGVLDNSLNQDEVTNTGVGFIESSQNNEFTLDKGYVETKSQSVTLTVEEEGSFEFSSNTIESFNTLGLSIEVFSSTSSFIEMKVSDIKINQKYEVTLSNGEPLPKGLSFDEKTGFIKGLLEEDLEIRIKAISEDGTIRILDLKIDVSKLKESSNTTSTLGLQQQLANESFKMNEYGQKISSLFS